MRREPVVVSSPPAAQITAPRALIDASHAHIGPKGVQTWPKRIDVCAESGDVCVGVARAARRADDGPLRDVAGWLSEGLCDDGGVGMNSQQRRDAKRRKARARMNSKGSTSGRVAPPPPSAHDAGVPTAELVDQLITAAIGASMANDEALRARWCDGLEALALTQPDETLAVLRRRLTGAVSSMWTYGWQPLDLVRVLLHRTAATHRSVLVAAIVAEHAALVAAGRGANVDPRWSAQLDRINAVSEPESTMTRLFATAGAADAAKLTAEVGFVVDLVAVLVTLPRLERLMPPPGEAHATTPRSQPRAPSSHLDAKVLARVRALLAKAESTTFDEEADALTSKAQELMARHAIDLAMLDASAPNHGAPVARRIHLDDPYVDAKSTLLSVVASENRCRSVFSPGFGFCTVFGFDADIDIVELLFTSMLTQATSSMVAADKQVDRNGRSRTRSFRQSFLVAFAYRIGERLREANEAAASQAAEDLGDAFLPVLATRAVQVETLVTEIFPKTRSKRSSVSNTDGWHAGRAAADKASIRPPGSLPKAGA